MTFCFFAGGTFIWILWEIFPLIFFLVIHVINLIRNDFRPYRWYTYAIPETSLYLHTYRANDSLYTFVGPELTTEHSSSFGVPYDYDMTAYTLYIESDSLAYLSGYGDTPCHTEVVMIIPISGDYGNPEFFELQYNENSIPIFSYKRPYIACVELYAGVVHINGELARPIRK